ncbi:MAG: hypothetical protein R3F31_22535 [Verrucomicrobiales bacterium]
MNHAGVLGKGKDTGDIRHCSRRGSSIRPKENGAGHYQPLLVSLGRPSRKAEQTMWTDSSRRSRPGPTCSLPVGGKPGRCRCGIPHPTESGCAYIFFDFEDFVDPEIADVLGQKLGRSKVKTYVQPAAARTEHLPHDVEKLATAVWAGKCHR